MLNGNTKNLLIFGGQINSDLFLKCYLLISHLQIIYTMCILYIYEEDLALDKKDWYASKLNLSFTNELNFGIK